MTSEDYIKSLNLIPHPEGGFFREFYRSGSENSMKTRGQTDFDVPSNYCRSGQGTEIQYCPGISDSESISCCHGRENRRPDKDIRRNCITSIIWMPTLKEPLFKLCVNESDHVLYWQGGLKMQFILFNPQKGTLDSFMLGPNISDGDMLQIPAPGGHWRGGFLVPDTENPRTDYCLVGEAVAPGFDFYDFSFVTESMVNTVKDACHRKTLMNVLRNNLSEVSGREAAYAEEFYEVLHQ